MSAADASQAARALELLWGRGRTGSRGPRQRLTAAAIAAAATEVAKREGLDALSMRRVAQELGVGAMTLYTYVAGKAELLDLMIDAALGEAVAGASEEEGWRDRLESYARSLWALYHRHPWLLQVDRSRAVLGPHALEAFETALSAVDGLGLTGREMVGVASLVDSYVRGAAQAKLDAERAPELSGVGDQAWWEAREATLETLFDPARFSTLARVGAERALDEQEAEGYLARRAEADFEFGLERVLDGVDALIRRADGRAAAGGRAS